MTAFFTDEDFPADPYPGARPDRSFLHRDGRGYALPDRIELDGRIPILAYGSNACPSKITWLRENLGLSGAVVVLRVRCTGLAAVWAAGLRLRDGQRPATLTAMPGVAETHAVWLATQEQLAVLDVCEGRGERYHLARLNLTEPGTGEDGSAGIAVDGGTRLPEVFAYVGASPHRMPLLVDGRPVRTAEVPQREAVALLGVAAPAHGLDASVVQYRDTPGRNGHAV
ncbi:MAG TPA: gamma-glutamylcyclotransferase [Amycolatopsis sp.]|jgi:hypothetical protein|nr:gamma-glutamylcyclotransferase [Amycolatopsis sp.]